MSVQDLGPDAPAQALEGGLCTCSPSLTDALPRPGTHTACGSFHRRSHQHEHSHRTACFYG